MRFRRMGGIRALASMQGVDAKIGGKGAEMRLFPGESNLKGDELLKCLAYFEEELRIMAFQEKEADIYNNTVVAYGKSMSTDHFAAKEMFTAARRLSQAGGEILMRRKKMSPIPELAARMYFAWQVTYSDYAMWTAAQSALVESVIKGMEANGEHVKGLLSRSEKSRHEAEAEEKRLLRLLNLNPDKVRRLFDDASNAIAAEKWQPEDAWEGTTLANPNSTINTSRGSGDETGANVRECGEAEQPGKVAPARIVEVFGFQNTVESLCKALGNWQDFVRGQAAAALGDLGDTNAVPALIDALQDESSEVRGHCVVSLMTLKDSRAVTPLIEMLRDDDPQVCSLAAVALGELGDRDAVRPVIEALGEIPATSDEAEHVVGFLVALTRLCDKNDIPLILDALREFGEGFSASALVILRSLCDPDDIHHLEDAVGDENESVSRVATILLLELPSSQET